MKEKKYFSVAKLTIGDNPFTLANFSKFPAERNTLFEGSDGNQHDRVVKKKRINNQFLSLYIEEGEALPRPPSVYNTNTKADEANPRDENQIERNIQTFVLIDEPRQRIFISDFRKKKTIEDLIKGVIKEDVLIKNIIDKEQFIEALNGIESVFLSGSRDLFSRQDGILSEQLAYDIHNYGTDIKQMEIKIFFQENTFPKIAKQKIFELFRQQENLIIEKLEVTGRSDEGFERIFNAEGIVDKVEVEAHRRDDGLFEENSIFAALVEKIR